MSYTITVKCQNKGIRDEVYAFLQDEPSPWGPLKSSRWIKRRGLEVGFWYTTFMGWEREYIYTVIRWLALKVGVRDIIFGPDGEPSSDGSGEKYPYYLYDGSLTPLVLNPPEPSSEAIYVDTLGIEINDEYWTDLVLMQTLDSSDPLWERKIAKYLKEKTTSGDYRKMVLGHEPFQERARANLNILRETMQKLDSELVLPSF